MEYSLFTFCFVEIFFYSFCVVENQHCNFHSLKIIIVLTKLCKIANSAFHIEENIFISSTKFFSLFNCGSFVSILSTLHIVHRILCSTFYAHCDKHIILIPVLRKILNYHFLVLESIHCTIHIVENSNCIYHIVENITMWFLHCGSYQHFFHTLS